MNLYDSDWDVERSYGDARMRMMHVGRRLGSELLGATVFEIEPGSRACPTSIMATRNGRWS